MTLCATLPRTDQEICESYIYVKDSDWCNNSDHKVTTHFLREDRGNEIVSNIVDGSDIHLIKRKTQLKVRELTIEQRDDGKGENSNGRVQKNIARGTMDQGYGP